MPQVQIIVSYKGVRTVYDMNQDLLLLGRPNVNRKVDVDLSPDMRTSRVHAELSYQDGIWWVRDQDSHNGTERSRPNMTIVKVSSHQAAEVLPGDELLLGDSVVIVDFNTDAVDPSAILPAMEAVDEASVTQVDEVIPPPEVSEQDVMSIMAGLTDITNSEIGESMLDQCLAEIQKWFGDKAEYYCILLRKDKELLPYGSLPRGRTRARFSYTLSRTAIHREQAFRWPDSNIKVEAVTTDGIVESMYAPIITSGEVSGVIHVGSDKPGTQFSSKDIQMLSLMAKTIAPAVQRDWFIGEFRPDSYPQVFISYSHKEKDFVLKFALNLRRRFVRVWFDEQLQTGKNWRESLAKAIRNADCFVLICSPESMKSDFVKWEINTAQSFGKEIVPIMLKQVDLPDTIAGLQYITLNDEMDAETQEMILRELIDVVKKTVFN